MSTPNDNKRQQLISKLKEMFQMDQADLDFGIYRIMNAKRDEISQFLEQDLLPTLLPCQYDLRHLPLINQ